MDTNQLIKLCIEVLKDKNVIIITVITLVFIALINYTVNYRKKPPRPKKSKAPKAAPAPKPEEKKEEAAE